MLYYLWTVCQELLPTVTYTTLIHTLLERVYGRRARLFHGIALGVGSLGAAVFSWLKLTSNLILTSQWNHGLYGFIMGFTLAFLLLIPFFGRRENRTLEKGGWLLVAAGSGLSVTLILYKLPVVLMYPFNFNTMGNGFFSAYYMERLAGWLIAMAVLFIYARGLYACGRRLRRFALVPLTVSIGVFSYGFWYCLGRFLVPWVTRARWLNWPEKFDRSRHAFLGAVNSFASAHAMFFIWLALGLAAVIAVALFLECLRIRDPYDNHAQLRKLRAWNRRYRRTAAFVLCLLVLFVVDLTAVKAYDTREVELSDPETYTVSGDQILVPIDLVNDGHLHRFEYRTENNVNVRWIVVKKPGSASFGVGLDACEVCGSAGYYERDGKVVCKRCDVVMNINTIGFQGGCNPIPLSYQMTEGNLTFALADILAAERQFK